MFFYYKKKGGEVAMRADSTMVAEGFEVLEYTPTNEELAKINQNYDLFVVDGKLECKETEIVRVARLAQELKQAKNELLNKASSGEVTNSDILDFLTKI